MLEIFVAQELEESLSDVEASVGDLVGAEEIFLMTRQTFEFYESLVTMKDITEMVQDDFFNFGRAKVSPSGRRCPSLS